MGEVKIVVGLSHGDEGKARVVDLLAQDAKAVVRFQGGCNAGHTVVDNNGIKYKFNLIPSGILNPNVWCILASGVVIDPAALQKELDSLNAAGISTSKLVISKEAHITMPWHKSMEAFQETAASIGTTMKGIGPTYADRTARLGVQVKHLLDENVFLKRLAEIANTRLANGTYDRYVNDFNLAKEYIKYKTLFEKFIQFDAFELVADLNECSEEIIFEGAQGTCLDISNSNYPYVTSSNTVAGAATLGTGIGPTDVDKVYGVFKAYATKVGSGEFPGELNKNQDEIALSEKLVKIGHEYGTVTGRMRRCGWTDVNQLRRAIVENGVTDLVITKLDVLDYFPEFSLYDSSDNTEINFIGWLEPTNHIRKYDDLPNNAKKLINFLEQILKKPISYISVGPERDQIIKSSWDELLK